MAEILELIGEASLELINTYSDLFLDAKNLFEFFVKQLSTYILLQVVMFIFPFVRSFINKICFPFRWVHVYLHTDAAKTVFEEIKAKYEEDDDPDDLLDTSYIRSSLVTGLDRPDERSSIILASNRYDHARRIALAPGRFSLILMFAYIIVAPLMFLTNSITTSYGALIHLYFFVGIFCVMSPSGNDYYYIFHSMFVNFQIKRHWIYVSVFVYMIVTIDLVWRFGDFFIAIFIATLFFVAYLVGLFVTAWFGLGGRIRSSILYYVPDDPELVRKDKYVAGKVSFSLEEYDIS